MLWLLSSESVWAQAESPDMALRGNFAQALLYGAIPVALAMVVLGAKLALSWYLQRRSGQAPVRYDRWPLVWGTVVWVLGMVLTAYWTQVSGQKIYTDAWLRFQQQIDRIQLDIESQFDRDLLALQGLQGLFRAQGHVDSAAFARYVGARELPNLYPGVRGFGWVERVQRSDLPQFVAQRQRDQAPDFTVKTQGDAPELYIIKYIEPLDKNRPAWGFDLGSESVRRAAVERAVEGGKPVLSGRITLLQDGMKRPGFLYFVPVYQSETPPVGKHDRKESLRGLVYSPLVLSELVLHTVTATQGLTEFQLYEGAETTPESLLFDSEVPMGTQVDSHAQEDRYDERMFETTRALLLGGQLLRLRGISTQEFERTVDRAAMLHVAAAGATLSVLAGLLVWLLLVGRARAQALATAMVQDVERLAMLARGTSSAVIIVDTKRHITWVNEGFSHITGYSAAEALGQDVDVLLHSDNADPAEMQRVRQAMDAGENCQALCMHRSKQGHDYWDKLEVHALRNATQKLTGWMYVQSDVTEEVHAKEALAREKERVDNILSGTNVGTWEFNTTEGQYYVNERWSLMLGFSPDEVVPTAGEFWQARVNPEDFIRFQNGLMAYCIGKAERFVCDVRVQRKDGTWMWILSRANAMSRRDDGSVEWLGGVNMDVTDSKRVEERLMAMESFLNRAGRVAGVGAWEINLRTHEIAWSEQICEIHGVEPGFKPTLEQLLSYYAPEGQEVMKAAMDAAVTQGRSWDFTTRFFNADGQMLWVRSVGEVEFDDAGAVRLVGALQDVTRDKDAQDKLARSESILRGAIDAINEAFVLYDPQDRLVFCNDKYRALYGMSADLIVPGATFESIVRMGAERGQYPEAMGRVDEWVAERVAIHSAGNTYLEQRLESGQWLRIVERKMPDGHIVGFRVDITELKRATESAQAANALLSVEQARLQNILEGTNVGTWEWDITTGKTLYNERWAQIIGYTLEELGGTDIRMSESLFHPDDLPVSKHRLDLHFAGLADYYESESRMRHKDGHWVWVMDRGKVSSRAADGTPLRMSGTHMDITTRKLAETALADTTAKLQSVLDSAVDVAVIATDLQHVVTVFNRGAERLLGYDADELIGVKTTGLIFETSQLEPIRHRLASASQEPLGPHDVLNEIMRTPGQSEWVFLRKDAKTVVVSLVVSPMLDGAGHTIGYLAIAHDISRQKEYEASLQEAMRLAEQSSVAKSQFLANMSHEIRTPMNAILGMLQLLHNTPLTTRQRDYTEKTEGAARSLLGLLNDILDFSKVEAGKMQLDPEPFILDELLADLSVILSANLGGKNVDVVFDVDPAIPQALVGDSLRLKQILINLGGNAVKFTAQGHVMIQWTLVALHETQVDIEVAVRDSGIGIAPENQAKIFEGFSQAEASTTRRFGGTGLGLAISRRLVQLMGSDLSLHSELGKGSTFSFGLSLPRAQWSAGGDTLRPVDAAHSVRVMVVDDNPVALASTARMMHALHWEVLQAHSGAQAVALIQQDMQAQGGGITAVFVDWQMPDMDGWDTLRAIAQLYAPPVRPAMLMLSGQGREILAQRSAHEQELLQGFLVKPLTATMLQRALGQAQSDDGPAELAAPALAASHQRPLAGMRILVTEDNPINQQVAKELLTAQGAEITLADNGRIAVDAIAAMDPPFDVVLMDLQMPVMDGLEAARAIRLGLGLHDLPVIAMTANAMASDREDCLAAGMNDHVGKPFDLQKLIATLIRWTQWQPQAGAPLSEPQAGAPVPKVEDASDTREPAYAWPQGLDIATALARMGGNTKLLARTMQAFMQDATQVVDRIGAYVQAHDPVAARRDVHAFKGLAATLGATALTAVAARAEHFAQQADYAQRLPDALKELGASIAETLPAMRLALQQLEAPSGAMDASSAPAEQDVQQIRADLASLLQLLQADDMQAMEAHATLRAQWDGAASPELDALDVAMAELDFAQAAVACVALIDTLKA
jgi:two-component system, sensor histidine kinase and response regulator